MPNAILRAETGPGDLAMFLGIGEAWAHLVMRNLPRDPLVLDLGCGSGKLARFLSLHPTLSYVGVDLYETAILWCRRAFADRPRFRFEHFDGYSARYNPDGAIATTEYRLPLEGDSADLVVCGSLFTHLLEPDAQHYLAEIARVLKLGGETLISLHIDVPSGMSFVGDEGRMDVDEDYFLGLCRHRGLQPIERIGLVYGQVVHRLALVGPRAD